MLKVNTRRKTKRDAKILVRNYTTNIALWNNTINKSVIDAKMIPELAPLLKLAGYSGLIKPLDEEELLRMLPTFKTDKCEVTLFSSKKKVEVDDMPGLVGAIMKIEGALLKIDEWTDPETREPVVPPPAPYRPRKDLLPPKLDPKTNNNSSKKIIQRFNYQFRALGN